MKYYVYALDVKRQKITFALSSFPDEEAANRACEAAIDKIEEKHGTDGFCFDCISICSRTDSNGFTGVEDLVIEQSVEVPYPLLPSGKRMRFDLADFEKAEQRMEEKLEKLKENIPPNCRRDVRFIYYVKRIADGGQIPDFEAAKERKPQKAKKESSQPKKPRKPRYKKYEVHLEAYLISAVDSLKLGNGLPQGLKKLNVKEMAELLKENDEFKNTKITSIEYGIGHSEVWKNRKKILKDVYDTGTYRNRRTPNNHFQNV